MKRQSGILMPIFSLPSKFGIGDFGAGAYKFIDFLVKAGQSVWQILPLVQTGYGNSPYSSVSAETLNPYFISPELLKKDGLLTSEEINFSKNESDRVDYEFLYSVRYPLLRSAYARFDKTEKGFLSFIKSGIATDYALFMTLKNATGQKPFCEWEDKYKYRDKNALNKLKKDCRDEYLFWQFVQYKAFSQWKDVKAYANKNGLKILGDLPLYVALDSVDVWREPKAFKLDENFSPKKKAGVPPDYFCADGQLWGNPVYDYEYLEENGFSFWVNRVSGALKLYDYIRIDHFRGLDRYYEIDALEQTARNGVWVDVPSEKLFGAIFSKVDKTRIIAEDLGIIDDGVRSLMKKIDVPGMKILSFAFNGDKDNLYLPENIEENSICYTGTHDNDTLLGLISSFNEWDYNNFVQGVKNSLELAGLKGGTNTNGELVDSVIKLGMNSKSKLFILPLQDVIKADGTKRINIPGIISENNWSIRFTQKDFSALAISLKKLTAKFGRIK